MANIRDIAKLTGYSVSTVSRVINHHPYVDEEKRQHILRIMKEVNYVPNRNARNLSVGQTKNIGVILPFINHPYFDGLLKGITTQAFACGYKITLLPTFYEKDQELNYLEEFSGKMFDALIITSRANSLTTILPYRQYGTIIFCEDVPQLGTDCTFINRHDSIKEALRYLKKQGYKKLGITLGRNQTKSSNSKITLQLAKEIFPNFSEADVFWNALTEEDGLQAATFFKERQVDAIFTNGDLVAAGIFLQLPSVKIIGRDNLFVSHVLNFSTIDHHLETCGQTAFNLAIGSLSGKHQIHYTFIQRAT